MQNGQRVECTAHVRWDGNRVNNGYNLPTVHVTWLRGSPVPDGLRKRAVQLHLAMKIVLAAFIADGYFQAANAQCGPNDKIYIDPRLVPLRPAYNSTPQQQDAIAHFLIEPSVPDWQKKAFMENLARQQRLANEPIVMPFTGGSVLIHPQNPCIQQFVPN